jgi:CheY-like chemotaxis protein
MPYRILVVDDNQTNLTLISKILGMDGYLVTLACNELEAIRSVIQYRPDMAVLDVMMPDVSGYDLCRKLRQPPYDVKAPIVMLTAMNSETERQTAKEAGADEIWSKPFDMDLFRRRISELLGSSKPSDD